MSPAIRWIAVLLVALLTLPAFAQRNETGRARASGAYEAEVSVRSQSDADVNAGLSRALTQVLERLGGRRANIGNRPGVAEELRRARDYADHYSFRQDESRDAGGTPRFSSVMVVRFNPAKVNQLAGMAGLSIWPEPRPRPVLWLAIDDGSGPRLVGLQQNNAARSILDRARARGYSLGLPAGNAAEQAAAAAIWRGDTAAIARISRAYAPAMQLLGKLYRAGNGWRADWTFVDNGRVLGRTSTSDADARRAMAGGADMAADALIRRYARPAGPPPSPPGDFQITITGLINAEQYLALMSWLEAHPQVGQVTPIAANGDSLTVLLHLKSGMGGFRRALERDGMLTPAETENTFQIR